MPGLITGEVDDPESKAIVTREFRILNHGLWLDRLDFMVFVLVISVVSFSISVLLFWKNQKS